MEIENEGKYVKGIENEEIENGQAPHRMRGKKKRTKQGWEETIEVILPKCITENFIKDQKPALKNKKVTKKQKQSVDMEIEEEGVSSGGYKKTVQKIQERSGQYKKIFELNDYYHNVIDEAKLDIQRKNFDNLIESVLNIIQHKMVQTPNFLNYIQLFVDKSHLDLLNEFNKQLEDNINEIEEDSSKKIHIIKYSGGNQLFKILTHFKNSVDILIEESSEKSNSKQNETIMCLFDGAYNISKQDMVDIGKFLQEEYEHYSDRFSIVILLPISQLMSVADIQIYIIEFCKSKDLFVKFLLFFLKQEQFPPLPQELLKRMLYEFDLYQITYNEQIRRVKLALTNFLFTHQDKQDLIDVLLQMKQNSTALDDTEMESELKEEENEKEEKQNNKNKKRMRSRSYKQVNKVEDSQSTKMQENKKTKVNERIDLQVKKQEIKAIVSFFDILYGLNFRTGLNNEGDSFSQSVINSNHRVIELILNQNKRYVMPQTQQNDFIKNPSICDIIMFQMKSAQEEFNFFSSYIKTFENLDAEIKQDTDKQQKMSSNRHKRYEQLKSQQAQSGQNSENTMILKRREKVEDIIRQITNQVHKAFEALNISEFNFDFQQFNSQSCPDLLGSIFNHMKSKKFPENNNTAAKKKETTQIVSRNSDGMNLLYLSQDYGKCINIQESYNDFKSLLRESNIETDTETNQAAYYNAICELRFQGLIEEKRKLKNEFIRHFFAKSSFFKMRR